VPRKKTSEFNKALAVYASKCAILDPEDPERVAAHQKMVDERLVYDIQKALSKAPTMSDETRARVIALLDTVRVPAKVAVPLRD
jgi:hypothetical protein